MSNSNNTNELNSNGQKHGPWEEDFNFLNIFTRFYYINDQRQGLFRCFCKEEGNINLTNKSNLVNNLLEGEGLAFDNLEVEQMRKIIKKDF